MPALLLTGVFLLALLIRLLYIKQILPTPIFFGLATDAEKYGLFALQILKGNFMYKDSIYLNPLYPFFLAPIYFIFGQSHLSVVLMQATIDSLSCLLIYYIASTLFNKWVGTLAAFLYACYGIAIFYTGILLATTAVTFLTLLFTLFLSGLGQAGMLRDYGVIIGVLEPGPKNAITDVDGVRVGHFTLIEGNSVRTGATAILPPGDDLFQEKVPAAMYVGNGFGKLTGYT